MSKDRIRRRVIIDGKQQWITAKTEQEYAEALYKAMCRSLQKSEPEYHNFVAYASDWFEVFSKPNIDTVTAITYERALRLYVYPQFSNKAIERITTADIQQLFNEMDSAECKKTTATKMKVKTVLNMVFQQAIEDGLMSQNPLKSKSIRIKGEASTVTPTYTVEQMQYLASHIDDIISAGDRNYFVLQAFHPMRLEEVLGLRWKDIDLEMNTIHIRNTVTYPARNQPVFAEKTKTEASRRTIPLVAEIKHFLTPSDANCFVVGGEKPISYTQVRRMCNRIQRQTGFDEKITPIRFRTTVLTDLYDQTKDIKQTQAVAGHTTAAMTLKHYVKGREHNDITTSPIASIYGLR